MSAGEKAGFVGSECVNEVDGFHVVTCCGFGLGWFGKDLISEVVAKINAAHASAVAREIEAVIRLVRQKMIYAHDDVNELVEELTRRAAAIRGWKGDA